jgi:hypothetical protein
MKVPPEPTDGNLSEWARGFYNVYEQAMRQSFFIPACLLTTKTDKAVNVLLQSTGHVGENEHWQNCYQFDEMLILVRDAQSGGVAQPPKTAILKVQEMSMKLDRYQTQNPSGPLALVSQLEDILQPLPDGPRIILSEAENIVGLKRFKDILEQEKGEDKNFYAEVNRDVFNTKPPATVESFLDKLNKVVAFINQNHAKVAKCAPCEPAHGKRDRRDYEKDNSKVKTVKAKTGNDNKPTPESKPCAICGRNKAHVDTDHLKGRCPYAQHPNANASSGPWSECAQAKTLASLNWSKLPATKKEIAKTYE